jgi:hypothetical protein
MERVDVARSTNVGQRDIRRINPSGGKTATQRGERFHPAVTLAATIPRSPMLA